MPLFSSATAKAAGRFGATKSWGLFAKFKFLIYFLFVFFMLANAISLSIKAKDITPGVKFLGEEWLQVTKKLNEKSVNILQRGEILTEETGFFKKSWFYIKNFWDLIESIIILYIWLRVLTAIFLRFPIADESKRFVAFLVSLGVFFLVQMLVIKSFYPEESMSLPIIAFVNAFKAIISVIVPSVAKVSDKFARSNITEIVNQTVSEVKNATNISKII